MTPVFRFAPSPNGELHLGHAFSALVTFEMAQRAGGRFLLRIEDIDTARCREEFTAGIFDDLTWLGLSWEQPVLRQSAHFAQYESAAARLEGMGLLYPCFASRGEIVGATAGRLVALDPEGTPLYPGLHKGLSAAEVATRKSRGEPFTLRLDMDSACAMARTLLRGQSLTFHELDADGSDAKMECHPELWGDCVILRKEVPASYLLAATVDDARQGVTHITRGLDLFAATDVQRLIHVLLGFPEPLYHHHRLIIGAGGRKLSKSARDTSLKSLRAGGATLGDVRRMAGLD